MSNRQFQNFCEYQLRGSQNRCFALPNFSFGKTTLNNNIIEEFGEKLCEQNEAKENET